MGTLGISHFSKSRDPITWVDSRWEVQKITHWSVQQSRKAIKARGDQDKLEMMFDNFYTWPEAAYNSNNSAATIHEAKTGNVIGYTHIALNGDRMPTGRGASDGAEGNVLNEILADLIENDRAYDHKEGDNWKRSLLPLDYSYNSKPADRGSVLW